MKESSRNKTGGWRNGSAGAARTEAELASGYLLDDRFRIRETVGRSGMATIYRAEDAAQGDDTVAIKVPRPVIENDPVNFARFLQEEKIGAKLDHPSLVKVRPSPGNRSRPYIVMEYLRGRTLAHWLHETRPLPEAEALRIASAVCEALRHMHEHGVIHRDLKPANIMICDDRTLRLFDFGLASAPLRQRSVLAKLTSPFGTPEYMAPEQVANDVVDERTDIYGLGAILFEMLTGEVPFRQDDVWASAYARMSGDPIAPRKLRPALSPQAEEIVLHAMQRDPNDRYPTAAAFRAELDAPERVRITGYCERLQAPRWRLSFQATPILAGLLVGFGVLALLFAMFFVLRFLLK